MNSSNKSATGKFAFSERFYLVFIAAISILDIAVSFYYLSNGTTIVFQNIYYFTIVLASYRYKWRGALFSTALSIAYLGMSTYYFPQFDIFSQAVIRTIIFILIAVVVAYLSLSLEDEKKRYHTIFSKAESGMITVRADDHTIKEANRRFSEITQDAAAEGKSGRSSLRIRTWRN